MTYWSSVALTPNSVLIIQRNRHLPPSAGVNTQPPGPFSALKYLTCVFCYTPNKLKIIYYMEPGQLTYKCPCMYVHVRVFVLAEIAVNQPHDVLVDGFLGL